MLQAWVGDGSTARRLAENLGTMACMKDCPGGVLSIRQVHLDTALRARAAAAKSVRLNGINPIAGRDRIDPKLDVV